MARSQRNNITRLPWKIREQICQLLLDGKTYDEIRNDPIVISGCQEQGKSIHNTSIGAYKNNPECLEYFERVKYSKYIWGKDLQLIEAYRKLSVKEKDELLKIVLAKSS